MKYFIETGQCITPETDYYSERPVISEYISFENLQKILKITIDRYPISKFVSINVTVLINHELKSYSTLKLHYVKFNIDEFVFSCKYIDCFHGRSIWMENLPNLGEYEEIPRIFETNKQK